MQLKRLLIFCDWFRPGYKAGGPITSIANLALTLSGEFDIYVFTSDRDLGDDKPYPGLQADQWVKWNDVNIFYASPTRKTIGFIHRMIDGLSPDCIYLNSMFSRYYTVYPIMAINMYGYKGKVVLAPRGMLRSSAVKIKRFKKEVFIRTLKASGLINKMIFHATDHNEELDVHSFFGENVKVLRIGNMTSPSIELKNAVQKTKGSVRVIFVGRIHSIKNLRFLLKCLMHVRVSVFLSVVGFMDDEVYWMECKTLMAELPGHVEVEYLSGMSNEEIKQLILEYHLFVSPTTGENYGHAIFEAMMSSRPVLISDQTPWRNLEAHMAGWDLPLSDLQAFIDVIDRVGEMSMEELEQWTVGAYTFSKRNGDMAKMKNKYLDLFG